MQINSASPLHRNLALRVGNGLELDHRSNQTFNLALDEWTPFHWSSYKRHKIRTRSSPLPGEKSTEHKTGNLVLECLAPRGQTRNLPHARAPGLSFNDDQRGRDAD
jgi:hypothetical protein